MTKNCIFVHIPKNAGTSIVESIKEEKDVFVSKRDEPYANIMNIKNNFDETGISSFGHLQLYKLNSLGIISNEYLNSSFKFCVVRNPYDRMVSLYKHVIRSGIFPVEIKFENFVDYLTKTRIPTVDLYNVSYLSQCNPQVQWIGTPNGQPIVDFIARFENLQEDFEKIKEILDIDVELKQENVSEGEKDYRSFYDDETKEKVKEMYIDDLQTFEYEF